jgi:hypothetical protein
MLVARQYLALDVWTEAADSTNGGLPSAASELGTTQYRITQREQRRKVMHARAVCDEVSEPLRFIAYSAHGPDPSPTMWIHLMGGQCIADPFIPIVLLSIEVEDVG